MKVAKIESDAAIVARICETHEVLLDMLKVLEEISADKKSLLRANSLLNQGMLEARKSIETKFV